MAEKSSDRGFPDLGLEISQTKVVSTPVSARSDPAQEAQSSPAQKYHMVADPTQEYVAGGSLPWYRAGASTLSWAIDDVSGDFGEDVYEQMLNDPTIISCINVLKTAILSGGLRIVAFQSDSSEPVPPLAQEMAEFVSRVINDLETPIPDVLWNMMDALWAGNKVAELVYIMAYRTVRIPVEVDEDVEDEEDLKDLEAKDKSEESRRVRGDPGEKDLQRGDVDEIRRPISALPKETRKSLRQGSIGFGAFSRMVRNIYMAIRPGATEDQADEVARQAEEAVPDSEVGENQEPATQDLDPTPSTPITRIRREMIEHERPFIELRRIKVKPRKSTAFVVDPFMNIVGIMALLPGSAHGSLSSSVFVGADITPPNLLPPAKFAVLTFRPKDSDPRGTSILRPGFNAWWVKRQVWPEYLKYLAQFASPSLIGYTAPDEDFVTDVDDQGHPVDGVAVTAEQAMLQVLIKLRGGSVAVFKNGAKVDPLQMTGDGAAFRSAIELLNTEMVTAILHQKLAIMDSEHNTRAAASVHQDTLQSIFRQARDSVIRMIRRDVITPLIRYNYGDEAVAWAPMATLGETEQTDFAAVASAIASLMKAGFFDPSQMQDLDLMLGLSPRPQAAVDQQAAAKQAGYKLAEKVASGEISLDGDNDNNGRPDSEE